MDSQRDAILKKHLNDMEIWLEEENINRNSNLGKELLKQTRELIVQHYEIEELKKETAQENNLRAVNIKTINQMRIEHNLKPIEGGDITIVRDSENKLPTPYEQLVKQIEESFQYSNADAEEYAKKLKDMALEEYRKELEANDK
ncbi:hypothetical protein FDF18_02615 [Clostridium sporogenes]|uniref:hypothetical protein n=1 Tax=Clostridium sporogenes TaxID=1509 RepID=UPI0013D48CEC|nr:hypothetical protein [Clostridium sporogenes]NFF68920.1 hypothetical protein [Clostridium sporogenes]NFG00373.1 hypothetical protein [Clostridium sporogenes]NFG08020.1 hypothetical protein [Clostridium sporogenes]NFG53225.1 hypothetical protein [Clostridium sporogenes]NFP86034.1 hypothetical protein [Clostridium sporogenes]